MARASKSGCRIEDYEQLAYKVVSFCVKGNFKINDENIDYSLERVFHGDLEGMSKHQFSKLKKYIKNEQTRRLVNVS